MYALHTTCRREQLLTFDRALPAQQTAVTERGLDDLIRQARKENPFPFDHERRSDARANNPPFPFPAAKD